MADDFDKGTLLKIANETLEQAKFKKDNANRIEVRVGNNADSPMYCAMTTPYGSTAISIYDDTLSVPENTETKILSFTVPPSKVFKLYSILVSGENIARFEIKIDNTTNKVLRTHYASGLNTLFKYDYLRIAAGSKIEVFVLSKIDGNSDYDATIEGELENE